MKFGDVILAGLIIYGVFSTQRGVRGSRTKEERFFAIRMAMFSWIVGFLFVVALLFLPNKQRVLMMLPLFVVVVTVAKLWRSGKTRLRREAQTQDRFDGAKRVN